MVKNKKFMVIMVILVLGAVLFTGCGTGAGGETGLEDNPEVTDSAASADEEQAGESQATATVSGTLKTINAVDGTVTIATENGDELVLNVTSESQIIVSESLTTLAQLENVIGSKVSLEYHAETKNVTVISIQD